MSTPLNPEEILRLKAESNRQAFYERLLNPPTANPPAIPLQFDADSGLQRIKAGNQIRLA